MHHDHANYSIGTSGEPGRDACPICQVTSGDDDGRPSLMALTIRNFSLDMPRWRTIAKDMKGLFGSSFKQRTSRIEHICKILRGDWSWVDAMGGFARL